MWFGLVLCCFFFLSVSLLLTPPGAKIDREKARLKADLEVQLSTAATASARVARLHQALGDAAVLAASSSAKADRTRKVLARLESGEVEMFERELGSIEELERLEAVGNPLAPGAPPAGGPLSPSPNWSQLAAELGLSGVDSQTPVFSEGSSSNA